MPLSTENLAISEPYGARHRSVGVTKACRNRPDGGGSRQADSWPGHGRVWDYRGVTRYASKTASMCRSAFSNELSDFTSPTSATYQFFAIWSSTVPP